MLRRGLLTIAALGAFAAPAHAAPAGAPELGYGGGDGQVEVGLAGETLDPVAIVRPSAASDATLVLARVYDGLDLEGGVLVKLTAAGEPDPSFGGGDGIAELPSGFIPVDVREPLAPVSGRRGRPLHVLATGELLVAGYDGQAVVWKLQADGTTPVGTFGTGGRAVANADDGAAASIAVRPTGEVLVAGTLDVGGGNHGIFVRELSSSGSPTTGLDGDGLVEGDPSPGTTLVDRIVDLQAQVSGGVVLARDVYDGNTAPDSAGVLAVQRYLTDGTIDPTFGTAGVASLGENVVPARLLPQPGGGFVLTGARAEPSTTVLSAILDADGQGSVPRSTSWGPALLRPATLLEQADGALALFGGRVEDGPRASSARMRADGSRDARWATTGAVATNVGEVGTGSSGDNAAVVDAVAAADGHSALALVRRGTAGVLRVVRVSLNGAPVAALTATPSSADGPSATITLDASGSLDPDGPTDDRVYRFDTDGDGSVDVTQPGASTTIPVTGPVTRTARVTVQDALGRISDPASATYEVRDGTPAPTPTPAPPAPTPPTDGGGLVSFPQAASTIFTPPTVQVGVLPSGPLILPSFLPPSGAVQFAAPVQVGGVDLSPTLPRDGDRVEVRFKVDLRNSGQAVSVCRVLGGSCATLAANPVVSRSGNVVSLRVVVTADAPQTLVRYRVGNAGNRDVEIPLGFAVRPAQTVPDYDIVGVELTQGTQRETASARTAPPDRDAPYDGVTLAGVDGEWGRPTTSNDRVDPGEIPLTRIRVWVVAHGVRSASAPAPRMWVSLGRPQLSTGGRVVRYGYAPLLRAPSSVPVTAETGLPPDLRGRDAVPYVFNWVPDRAVPRITVSLEGGQQCDDCPSTNDTITIRRPRVAVSRIRPTNVVRIFREGSGASVPDSADLLQAHELPRLRCYIGGPGNSSDQAERCADLRERLADEAPADGEAYRVNERVFFPGEGPLASLAPFSLGATPAAGHVVVPANADAFLAAFLTQHAIGVSPTRTTVALTAECVRTATEGCVSGTAVSPPLLGAFGIPAPTTVARYESRYRVAGLARGLHLAYGLRPASGRAGAVGAARWAPDEAGALGGFGVDVGSTSERGVAPSAALRPGCGDFGVRDLTSSCVGPASVTGANGGWISPRRWDALLVGTRERLEVVNGNVVSSGAELPCPYRALHTRRYASSTVGNCALPASTFEPIAVDQSFPRNLRAAPRQGAATAPAISVTLRTLGTAVTGLGLVRVDAPASALASAAQAAASSRVVIRGYDAGGSPVASSGAVPTPTDLGASGEPGTTVDVDTAATGLLPASPAIARIEALVDGVVVARSRRGAAPTVTLAPPASIGASGPVALGVRAEDADGDPLLSTLSASADAGKTWRTVATAGSAAALAVDGAALPAAPGGTGRLRVAVSDGYDTVTAVSGALSFSGPALAVRMLGTARRAVRGADTALAAAATDPTASIRWTVRGKRVGTGTTLRLGALPAGRHRVVATATSGRRTVRSAAVTVTVRSVPPVVRSARLLRGCRIRVVATDEVMVRQGRRSLGRVLAGRTRTVRARCTRRGRRATVTLVSTTGSRKLVVRR